LEARRGTKLARQRHEAAAEEKRRWVRGEAERRRQEETHEISQARGDADGGGAHVSGARSRGGAEMSTQQGRRWRHDGTTADVVHVHVHIQTRSMMGRVGAPRLCLDALIHCVCDTSVDTICITPSRRCSLAPTYSSTRGARTAHTVHVPPLHLD